MPGSASRDDVIAISDLVRLRLRRVAIVRLAQREDQLLRRRRALAASILSSAGVVEPILAAGSAEHRGEAVHVAAPVELARRLQVAAAARFERLQQARRLVVVVVLPADRQRASVRLSRETSENAKSISASCSNRG